MTGNRCTSHSSNASRQSEHSLTIGNGLRAWKFSYGFTTSMTFVVRLQVKQVSVCAINHPNRSNYLILMCNTTNINPSRGRRSRREASPQPSARSNSYLRGSLSAGITIPPLGVRNMKIGPRPGGQVPPRGQTC